MHTHLNKQPQPSHFNDYTIPQPSPTNKLLLSSQQDRSISSNSIYYQQNNNTLSRKKLTVVSRDNTSRQDIGGRGDYIMIENGVGSHKNSQASDSLRSSGVQRSKLKRPVSPAIMTPTKVMKLKKSMLSQQRNQSVTNLSSHRNSHQSTTRPKFQTHLTSPIKFTIDNHRRLASTTSDVPVAYNHQTSLPAADNLLNSLNLQSVRREMSSLINLKVLEIQGKMKQQEEIIKLLESKLNDNQKKIKYKEHQVQELREIINNNREKGKPFREKQLFTKVNSSSFHKPTNTNDPTYILQRIKDLQSKYNILSTQQTILSTCQHSLNLKLSTIQTHLISLHSSKLSQIKTTLNKFLQHKSSLLLHLTQSVSYLDNKLIGRTQTIKETLCQLKQKVKEVEDSWTHKDTKATKESTTLFIKEDVQEYNITMDNKNNTKSPTIHRIQNKLRQITSLDDNNNHSNKYSTNKPLIGSLEFSITSLDQQPFKSKTTNNNKTNPQQQQLHKNVYYDQNISTSEMEDISIALFNEKGDDSSRLTDDFYYPGSNSVSRVGYGRNLSPGNNNYSNNRVGGDYYGCAKQTTQTATTFSRKLSPQISKSSHPSTNRSPSPTFKSQSSQQSPSSPSTVIKISNQQITKKMLSLQQLIQSKRLTSSESIEKEQLRCYVDKTGYLKYTDSKTFVFDKKGNLIPCSEGEFWFLVTKRLIYGKRDDQESRTMSFIQIDQ